MIHLNFASSARQINRHEIRDTIIAILAIVGIIAGFVALTVEEDGSGQLAGQTVTYCLPWAECHD